MARFEGEPFIDFKFGDYTNTDLGIKRVSSGNRYSYNINPTTKDITQENTGGWGTYYFKSYDKSRAFTIDFAFDHLTDTQLRLLRQAFAGDTEGDLIFAERPDWAYKAKVTGTPNIKFLAFENLSDKYSSNVINNSSVAASEPTNETTQIYKGEGQVQFTCYDPYSYRIEPNLFPNVMDVSWTYQSTHTWREFGRLVEDNTTISSAALYGTTTYPINQILPAGTYYFDFNKGNIPSGSGRLEYAINGTNYVVNENTSFTVDSNFILKRIYLSTAVSFQANTVYAYNMKLIKQDCPSFWQLAINQMVYFNNDPSHYQPITFAPTDFQIKFTGSFIDEETADTDYIGISLTFYYREGNENKESHQNISLNIQTNKIYIWKSKIGVVTEDGIPVNYSGPAYGFMPSNTYAYEAGYSYHTDKLNSITASLTFTPRSY